MFACIADSVFLLTPPWIALSLIVGILIGFLDRRHDRVFPILVEILLVSYVALVFGSTVVLRGTELREISFIPFDSYRKWMDGSRTELIYEDIANILMMIPVGIGVPVIVRRFRLLITLCATFLIEIVIETLQYLTRRGCSDIDDVLNGLLGALIGFGLYAAAAGVTRLFTKNKKHREKDGYV